MLAIGKKIKQARKNSKITQDGLAKAIGVSDKSISAYESDRIQPPLAILEKIAANTDHPVTYFLEDTIEASILAKLHEVEKQFKEIKKLLEEK